MKSNVGVSASLIPAVLVILLTSVGRGASASAILSSTASHPAKAGGIFKLPITTSPSQDFINTVQKHNDDLARQAAEQKAAEDAAKAVAAAEAAKQAEVAQAATIAPAAAVEAPAVVSGCGDNSYANYIYMHESGCNTSSVNSLGCRGIGQSCGSLPCSLSDYACQNSYFTAYALSRYGSWEAAYNFWIQNHWW